MPIANVMFDHRAMHIWVRQMPWYIKEVIPLLELALANELAGNFCLHLDGADVGEDTRTMAY